MIFTGTHSSGRSKLNLFKLSLGNKGASSVINASPISSSRTSPGTVQARALSSQWLSHGQASELPGELRIHGLGLWAHSRYSGSADGVRPGVGVLGAPARAAGRNHRQARRRRLWFWALQQPVSQGCPGLQSPAAPSKGWPGEETELMALPAQGLQLQPVRSSWDQPPEAHFTQQWQELDFSGTLCQRGTNTQVFGT